MRRGAIDETGRVELIYEPPTVESEPALIQRLDDIQDTCGCPVLQGLGMQREMELRWLSWQTYVLALEKKNS